MWLGNLLPQETHCGCLTSAHQRFWLANQVQKLLQSCLVSPLEATEQPPILPPKMPTRKVILWSCCICLWRIKLSTQGREREWRPFLKGMGHTLVCHSHYYCSYKLTRPAGNNHFSPLARLLKQLWQSPWTQK